MAEARIAIQEHHRVEILTRQAETWHRVESLRAYIRAMESKLAGSNDANEQASAQDWLEWARGYVDSIDPLKQAPTMPPPLEHDDYDLKPFLKGWNTYPPQS